MAAFIADQREQYGIQHATACRAVELSPDWFYKWRHGDRSARRARREQLAAAIRQLYAAHRGRYGSPRITRDLREAGWRVSKNTVAKVMRELGLVGRPTRRRRGLTRPGKGRWKAPDLIGRDFRAATVNQKWYGDGTEMGTDEGKLYLDSVLDMGSRRVVGFALGEHHDTELAYAALCMAVAIRGGKEAIAGVVFNTDQGSNTPAATTPPSPAISPSPSRPGRTGQCWDALAESFFASLKRECLHQHTWPSRAAARRVVDYIAWFNGTRLHSSLGYQTPNAFETATTNEELANVA